MACYGTVMGSLPRFNDKYLVYSGDRGSTVVKVLCYKSHCASLSGTAVPLKAAQNAHQ